MMSKFLFNPNISAEQCAELMAAENARLLRQTELDILASKANSDAKTNEITRILNHNSSYIATLSQPPTTSPKPKNYTDMYSNRGSDE